MLPVLNLDPMPEPAAAITPTMGRCLERPARQSIDNQSKCSNREARMRGLFYALGAAATIAPAAPVWAGEVYVIETSQGSKPIAVKKARLLSRQCRTWVRANPTKVSHMEGSTNSLGQVSK